MVRTIPVEQFHAELKAQGVGSREHFAFKCPMCGTVQSGHDLIIAGAGKTFADVERFLGFSCVGRWTNAGPHKTGDPPGRGCDWTLGGPTSNHKLVVRLSGKEHPLFEPATPEEAQAHQSKNIADEVGAVVSRRALRSIPSAEAETLIAKTNEATVADDPWQWATVEIIGLPQAMAGRIREEERFGAKLLRIDIPLKGDPDKFGWETHYYGGLAISSYTVTDQDTVMRANRPYEPPLLRQAHGISSVS